MREAVFLSPGDRKHGLSGNCKLLESLEGKTGEYFFKGGQTLSLDAKLGCECPGAPKVIALLVPVQHLPRKHSVPVHSGGKWGGGRSRSHTAISQVQTPLAAPVSLQAIANGWVTFLWNLQKTHLPQGGWGFLPVKLCCFSGMFTVSRPPPSLPLRTLRLRNAATYQQKLVKDGIRILTQVGLPKKPKLVPLCCPVSLEQGSPTSGV